MLPASYKILAQWSHSGLRLSFTLNLAKLNLSTAVRDLILMPVCINNWQTQAMGPSQQGSVYVMTLMDALTSRMGRSFYHLTFSAQLFLLLLLKASPSAWADVPLILT